MKWFWILGLSLNLTFNFSLFAHDLFQGQGDWKDSQGHTGTYSDTTRFLTVSGVTFLRAEYRFDNGKNDVIQFRGKLDTQGFFQAAHISGYCFARECHYAGTTPSGNAIEETISFTGNGLHKLGSRTVGGLLQSWHADLVRE